MLDGEEKDMLGGEEQEMLDGEEKEMLGGEKQEMLDGEENEKLDGEEQEMPDGEEPSKLIKWCECLTLIGLSQHPVALFDSAVLARCVATLGGLIARGLSTAGKLNGKLCERVCFLQPGDDWRCLAGLIKAVELTMKEHREMLLKCHPDFAALKTMNVLLEEYAHPPAKSPGLIKHKVRQPPPTAPAIVISAPSASLSGLAVGRLR